MKNKILIVSLADEFIDKLAEKVASDLGLFYLNIDKYLTYSIQEPEKMLATCGIDYLKKQESRIIDECMEFENTIFYVSYEVFVNNQDKFIDCKIIYPAIKPKDLETLAEKSLTINTIAFEDRDYYLQEIAYTVQVNSFIKDNYIKGITSVINTLENQE